MSEKTHAQSINAAERTSRELHRLFWKLGTKDHPRGRIISAYRVARKAIKPELEAGNIGAARAILIELSLAIKASTNDVLRDAGSLGYAQAERELSIYGLGAPGAIDETLIALGLGAVLSQFDGQMQRTLATLATGGAAALIIGDASRVGLLSPAPVIREAAKWTATAAFLVYSGAIQMPGMDEEYARQAIAGIDERTTDCCLRVHGQVVPMNGKFKLVGTPRYADELERSPFHDYCRTSICLVPIKETGDNLTRTMVDAARAELTARAETGERVEIHPADAFSRR